MTTSDREFELVVWGATGFTGRLTAECLLALTGTEAARELRWALGGRDRAKLEQTREAIARETGHDASGIPLLVGDGQDAAFVDELAKRTRVVCTTVGPYAKYGSKLVAACAANGTDYCDLTGEVHWMQQMIDAHQETAARTGARIVFTCGFDCIPSDLGVSFLQREMRARHSGPCQRIELRVKGFSGGASGGTIASMINMLEEAAEDPRVRRAMNEPYSLNPKGERSGPDGPEAVAPRYDEHAGQWLAPFVMATINTKVVRRSNALQGYAYGRDFRYDEAMWMGAGPLGFAKAAGLSAGSLAMQTTMSIAPLRRALSGSLPQPGDGPDRAKREAGYFDLRLRGESAQGHVLHARVAGDRDPGYGSTSRMLAESALCLARDELEVGGGLATPASALGDALLARLPRAGVTFRIED
jgi:short subunit dehydrogenase-like uncharacterized protein